MSYSAADGASLVAAAVQAAIRERAPRRTVAAVAAAVSGTVLSAAARPFAPATMHKERAQDAQGKAEESDDPGPLLERLRAVRRAQRQRKKEKRRAAKQAASEPPVPPSASFESPQPCAGATHPIAGAAGPSADFGGSLVAEPAQAPAKPPDHSPSTDPVGLALQLLPAPHAASSAAGSLEKRSIFSSVPSTAKPDNADLHVAAASGASVRSTPYNAIRSHQSKPGRR